MTGEGGGLVYYIYNIQMIMMQNIKYDAIVICVYEKCQNKNL